MPAVGLVLKAVVTVALLASMLRAFRGPPASPRRPRLGRAVAALALLFQVVAVAATLSGHLTLAAVAAPLGVEATCLAVWLGWDDERPPPDDDDGDDVPPVDWEAFDRARRAWDRPRAAV
jgi:hypothetical protein